MSKKVTFIGIGRMGSGMAGNILGAGFDLTVYNRSAEKMEPLAAKGARPSTSITEAVAEADIVCSIITNHLAVEEVLFSQGVAQAMKPGAVWVSMSSTPPTFERECAEKLGGRGVRHLDAPVSGGTKGAADGALAIMVGGEESVFEDAFDVLQAMGRPIRVGPTGAGQVAKLCNQLIVGITIGAVSEAMLLAQAGGADPEAMRAAIRGGFAESRILEEHGQRILDRNWIPGGQTQSTLKDLRNAVTTAEDAGLDLPFVTLAKSIFENTVDSGVVGYDHTAILLELERMNVPHRVGDGPDQKPSS